MVGLELELLVPISPAPNSLTSIPVNRHQLPTVCQRRQAKPGSLLLSAYCAVGPHMTAWGDLAQKRGGKIIQRKARLSHRPLLSAQEIFTNQMIIHVDLRGQRRGLKKANGFGAMNSFPELPSSHLHFPGTSRLQPCHWVGTSLLTVHIKKRKGRSVREQVQGVRVSVRACVCV